MLRSAQPDLINPVRCLTRLNTDPVFTGIGQFDGDGIIGIAGPAVNACGVDVQPVAQPDAAGAGSDLIIHLQPDRIRVAAVDIGLTPQPDKVATRRCRKRHLDIHLRLHLNMFIGGRGKAGCHGHHPPAGAAVCAAHHAS